MKILLIFFLCLLLTVCTYGQKSNTEKDGLVKWLSFKEAFELNKKAQKPFLVDVYTDWCGWCKHMIKTTYSDPNIAGYINNNFYPVKFNAETKDTIEYLGTKYFSTDPSRPKSTHQLAVKLLGNNQSYPSTVFLANNLQFTLLTAGYLDVKKIEPLLIYFVENIFRTTSYDDFSKYYSKAFPENPADTIKTDLKKYTLQKALELQKTKPRKILLDVYTNWCNGCKVMNRSTFPDSLIASYLNEKFYYVPFNAEMNDTVFFAGEKFVNTHINGMPFHDFIMKITNGNITLPSQIIFSEDLKALDIIPYYLKPSTLDPVLHFYGENAYKTQKWQDFFNEYGKGVKAH